MDVLYTGKDDGKFWMDWRDFCKIFNKIDVCDRTVGPHDLNLDVKEGDACFKSTCGPAMGCCLGCTSYWLCCKPRQLLLRTPQQRRTLYASLRRSVASG